MRIGELLALTKADIDIFTRVINVNKTYYRKDKRDIITSPKTKSFTRTITIPDFFIHEILEYYKQLFEYPDNERLFQIGARAVENLMKRHIEKTGLPSIRVYDLRHSHCAYLINKGVEPVVIKERLGHKHIKITLDTYGHLYPNRQRDVADMLGISVYRVY